MDSFNGSSSARASDPPIYPKIPLPAKPSEAMVVEHMDPATTFKNSLLEKEKVIALPSQH
jgi:hypothetical protein